MNVYTKFYSLLRKDINKITFYLNINIINS